jgi:GNAT superfamily N-acetyltransferase
MSTIATRQACLDDLDEIMRVEESWPEEQRASRDMLETRLRKFPQGFIVAELAGTIAGTLSSCLLDYRPAEPHRFESWNSVTNSGYLPDSVGTENALYLVSGVVDKVHRGKQVFQHMIRAIVQVAQSMDLEYVVAGAVLPGFDAYCREHGGIDAADYVFIKQGGRFVDPFMDVYRRLGFGVPDKEHVVADYYPDEASHHYAGIVVCEIESTAART